jgi:hypothetical protein
MTMAQLRTLDPSEFCTQFLGAIGGSMAGVVSFESLQVLGTRQRLHVPPASGVGHLRRILDRLTAIEPGAQDGSAHDTAAGRLRLGIDPGALVVMLSPLVATSVLERAIDWSGRGWDRGLRGIAFDGDVVYIAASDELFAYTPSFRRIGSWRNPYLRHCHEICVHGRKLFIGMYRMPCRILSSH